MRHIAIYDVLLHPLRGRGSGHTSATSSLPGSGAVTPRTTGFVTVEVEAGERTASKPKLMKHSLHILSHDRLKMQV